VRHRALERTAVDSVFVTPALAAQHETGSHSSDGQEDAGHSTVEAAGFFAFGTTTLNLPATETGASATA